MLKLNTVLKKYIFLVYKIVQNSYVKFGKYLIYPGGHQPELRELNGWILDVEMLKIHPTLKNLDQTLLLQTKMLCL